MFALNQQNSIANDFLAEIRDTGVQTDRLRFRTNLKRLGQLLAYEISRALDYQAQTVTTPLATTQVNTLQNQPVLISIMRAALPFYEGFLEMFDQADAGFIGAWRTHDSDNAVDAELKYQAAPDLNGRTVIVIDPMLATGKSLVKTVQSLLTQGTPAQLHLASVIAAPEGLDYVQKNIQQPHEVWTCAVDDELNEKAYIVPGLGDAGDLAFGDKL